MPEDVRAFRTYAKSSHSLQEASVTHPRAIFGDPRGGFFMSFNGHKGQKGFNEVELFALDKNVSPTKWIGGSIVRKIGRLQLKESSQRCAACHGNPLRPIWAGYPNWPNLFGSIDDW